MSDAFQITPYQVRSAGTDVPPEEVQRAINDLAHQTQVALNSVASDPTGPAGGDLGGTYPNPTVVALHVTSGTESGVTINSSPIGQTTPAAGAFTTLSATTPVAITSGGTGLNALTAHAVVIGEGSSAPHFAAPGVTGQMLLSAGASSDPVFGNNATLSGATINNTPIGQTTPAAGAFTTLTATTPVAVPSGGTGANTLTAHAVLLGEGTSTLGFAAPSTANFALLSTGATTDPTFQQLTAPMVNFTQSGTGGATRAVSAVLGEVVTLTDFGGVGDNATDNSTALTNFFNYIAANNVTGRIPAGVYNFSTLQTLTLSSSSGGINANGRRPQLIGDGSGNTCLFYTGATATALTITGTFDDNFIAKGFRVSRNFSTPAGTGVQFKSFTNLLVDDMTFIGWNVGFDLNDVNTAKMYRVSARNNNNAFSAEIGTVTAPNQLEFDSCIFSSNAVSVGAILKGTANFFHNCDFEANGNGTQAILGMTYDGTTGGASATFTSCYFEHSWGAADIYLALLSPGVAGSLVVQGCTFNRIDSAKFVTNNITVDASALSAGNPPFHTQIFGNGFMGYGTYVASAARPTVALSIFAGTYDGFETNDMRNSNAFNNLADLPVFPVSTLVDGEAMAWVSSAGALSNNFGVTAIAHTGGTGLYTLTMPRLTSGTALITATPSGSSISQISQNIASATTVNIQTANSSGTAADVGFHIRAKMR